MFEWILASLIFVLFGIALTPLLSRFSHWERRLLWLSLLAHFISVVGLVFVYRYIYGYGDMLLYARKGLLISAHLKANFSQVAPNVIGLLFHQDGTGIESYGGSATGSMLAIVGFVSFAFGDTLAGSCAVLACLAFLGKLGIYWFLRSELSVHVRKIVLISTMLVPSVVFWTSGILKEAVAIFCLGALVWGGYLVITSNRKILGMISMVIGAVLCALVKPYVLIPFAIASTLWLYLRRPNKKRKKRKKSLVVRVAVVLVGASMIFALGQFAPRYSVDNVADSIKGERENNLKVAGGSNFSLGSDIGGSGMSLLIMSPWAVLTAFLRPMIIEARSPIVMINSLETLVLTIMLVVGLRRKGFKGAYHLIKSSPALSFCFLFAVVLGLGVGLGTTNFGTLSRYRVPLVPFFAVVVGSLYKKKEKSEKKKFRPSVAA